MGGQVSRQDWYHAWTVTMLGMLGLVSYQDWYLTRTGTMHGYLVTLQGCKDVLCMNALKVCTGPLPGSLKGDVPASKDLPGKKSYLTMKAVERYVAESSCITFFQGRWFGGLCIIAELLIFHSVLIKAKYFLIRGKMILDQDKIFNWLFLHRVVEDVFMFLHWKLMSSKEGEHITFCAWVF